MARIQLTSKEIGSVQRNDFDIVTTSQAVITKVIAGSNVTISSTGVDTGTGDVTNNASTGTSYTFSTGLTYTAGTVTDNSATGVSGG